VSWERIRSTILPVLLPTLGILAPAAAIAEKHTSGPTGDPEAIALNEKEQQAYATLPGVTIVERGKLFARKTGRFEYVFQFGPRHGYRPATETIHLALSEGKVTAYLTDVYARHVGRFSILVNGKGAYLSDLGGDGCWQRTSFGAGPLGRPGKSFIDLHRDHYSPLRRQGSLVVSRLTYRIGRRIRVTVVQKIDPATYQVVSTRTTERAGKYHLTYRRTFSALESAPTFPTPASC
jgi:hypothetical protein